MEKFGSDYQTLAHRFIYSGKEFRGENYGRRMFAYNNILYSYGHHFIIAKKVGHNKIIVNTNTASNTTSKQQWCLKSAIPYNWEVIYVPLSDTGNKTTVIKNILCSIEKLLQLIPKARTRKQEYLNTIASLQLNANAYINLYRKKDFKLSKIEKDLLNRNITLEQVTGSKEDFQKNIKNLKTAQKRKVSGERKAKIKKRLKRFRTMEKF